MIKVPDNMSYVNAFRAIWEGTEPAVFFNNHPNLLTAQEDLLSTSEKTKQFFKGLNGTFVNYAGGRGVKTDFKFFPTLTVFRADTDEIDAVRTALQNYSQIPPSQRFDQNDACSFSEIHLASKL